MSSIFSLSTFGFEKKSPFHNVLGLYEACGKRKRKHYVEAFEKILLCEFCVQIAFFDFSKSAINQIDVYKKPGRFIHFFKDFSLD